MYGSARQVLAMETSLGAILSPLHPDCNKHEPCKIPKIDNYVLGAGRGELLSNSTYDECWQNTKAPQLLREMGAKQALDRSAVGSTQATLVPNIVSCCYIICVRRSNLGHGHSGLPLELVLTDCQMPDSKNADGRRF